MSSNFGDYSPLHTSPLGKALSQDADLSFESEEHFFEEKIQDVSLPVLTESGESLSSSHSDIKQHRLSQSFLNSPLKDALSNEPDLTSSEVHAEIAIQEVGLSTLQESYHFDFKKPFADTPSPSFSGSPLSEASAKEADLTPWEEEVRSEEKEDVRSGSLIQMRKEVENISEEVPVEKAAVDLVRDGERRDTPQVTIASSATAEQVNQPKKSFFNKVLTLIKVHEKKESKADILAGQFRDEGALILLEFKKEGKFPKAMLSNYSQGIASHFKQTVERSQNKQELEQNFKDLIKVIGKAIENKDYNTAQTLFTALDSSMNMAPDDIKRACEKELKKIDKKFSFKMNSKTLTNPTDERLKELETRDISKGKSVIPYLSDIAGKYAKAESVTKDIKLQGYQNNVTTTAVDTLLEKVYNQLDASRYDEKKFGALKEFLSRSFDVKEDQIELFKTNLFVKNLEKKTPQSGT